MNVWKLVLPTIALALVGAPTTAFARDDGPAAGLSETAASALSCSDPLIEHPFSAFGDDLDYVLAPNGSFESTNGWDFTGGAETVAGNDPFGLRSGTDDTVLSLPEGATATSPLMCVDETYPTFRFPAQQLGRKGSIRVEVSYPWSNAGDKFRKADAVKLRGEDGWAITDPLDLRPDRGGDGPGWRPMAIRLIAKDTAGASGFRIDDVYVDPRARW